MDKSRNDVLDLLDYAGLCVSYDDYLVKSLHGKILTCTTEVDDETR